ncbi:Bug family tripartite tricarboxylate transporter substrate binding protein [Variovorax sp. GT1P44]|uniref:Bug family tripartite tricarboxylate transporter substrate binding protein n=1 Tax=Variovorax sp. GT1P44 TaxID=3443742 RepID=UPI003F45A820
MTTNNLRTIGAAFACAAALTLTPVAAQLPTGDKISIVVPYSPGNGLDLLGREFSEILQGQVNKPVIVENREGAAGVIGTQFAMRAQPNGQTLLFTANPPFVTSPFTFEKPPYDALTSFTPVARVGSVPLVLVTSSKSPIRDLEQLKAFVRKDPKAASYASAGAGSPGQIFGELLNQAAGLQLEEIRYKSTGQALTDVISGNVLVSLVSVTAAAQHIRGGTLTALAVGSRQRLPDFKDVPTLAEALGQKDFEAGVWYGFFAPAGTPPDKVQGIYAEIAKAAESKRMAAFMTRQYMVPELLKPEEFAQALRHDADTSRKLSRLSLNRSK